MTSKYSLERKRRQWPALALIACLLCQHAFAADKWFLMARHGECFPIRSLERKFPDLGTIAEPQSFIRFVRAKGLKVDSKVVPVPGGEAIEVLVPERELALLFVTAGLCSTNGGR